MSKNADKCLVVNFCTGERTTELSDLCFEKLGFEHRTRITGDSAFHEKFIEFAKVAVDSEFDFFIRNWVNAPVPEPTSNISKLLSGLIKSEIC